MLRLKKKLILISVFVLLSILLTAGYFYFHSPRTLADVVGSQFMEQDQIIVLNGNNGNRKELEVTDKEELLLLLQKATIQNIESIDLSNGYLGCLEFIKGNDWFSLTTDGDHSFTINDSDHSKMIVYYLDKENGKKINNIMERYYL